MLLAGELAHRGALRRGWVEVDGAVVARLGHGEPPGSPDSELGDAVLARGLVDLQVNGGGGEDVTTDLDAVAALHLSRGVTSLLATVMTTDDETAARALRAIGERAADGDSPVAGAHLEGPFLSPVRPGVHRPGRLRAPADGVPAYVGDPAVRLVTVAPELPGALELIGALGRRAVAVSLGHTDASPERAEAAVRGGARMVTHLFNAMAPLHHRAPGVAGWALGHDAVGIGLIADGVHVAPEVLRLVHRLAGDRVLLVSDASVAAGAPPGRYAQAGVEVERTAAGEVRAPGGALAGGGEALDVCLARWCAATGASPARALAAAGPRPATAVGLPGELVPGAPADLVVLDAGLAVRRVMKAGAWVGAERG